MSTVSQPLLTDHCEVTSFHLCKISLDKNSKEYRELVPLNSKLKWPILNMKTSPAL